MRQWERRLALCFTGAVLLIAASCMGRSEAAPLTVPLFPLAHPLYPEGYRVCQRYDQRNRRGAIVKATWICRRATHRIYLATRG